MISQGLVSVIIPTYNREFDLERLLQSLRKQTYKKIEIIVVDDASTDNTAETAKKYTPYVITRKHMERTIQRNFGVSKSHGEYLLFLDDDMELNESVIEDCANVLANDSRVVQVTIPELSVASSFWEKVKGFERSFYNESGDKYTDAPRFFRRSIFEKVGGYDESITGPEDWDLPESISALGFKTGRINTYLKHFERVPNPIIIAKKKFYYGLKAHRYFSKQKVSLISPKTIYILRPVFWKNWKKLLKNPLLSIAMFIMLFCEQVGGGLGFVIGKFNNK